MTVAHREYITSIDVIRPDSAFFLLPESSQTPGWDLNPSYRGLFPWLGQIAQQWEKYQFSRCQFSLIPRQPTTARGRILAYFEYDYPDAPASNKSGFMNTYGAQEASTWMDLKLIVDCSRLNDSTPWRYTDTLSKAAEVTRDGNLVNAGYLVIAVDGLTPNEAYSWDLWVDYKVHLEIQKMSDLESQTLGFLPSEAVGGLARDGVEPTAYMKDVFNLNNIGGSNHPLFAFGTTVVAANIVRDMDLPDLRLNSKVSLDEVTHESVTLPIVPAQAGPGMLQVWATSMDLNQVSLRSGFWNILPIEQRSRSVGGPVKDTPDVLNLVKVISLTSTCFNDTDMVSIPVLVPEIGHDAGGLACVRENPDGSTILKVIRPQAFLCENQGVSSIPAAYVETGIARMMMIFNDPFSEVPPGTRYLTPVFPSLNGAMAFGGHAKVRINFVWIPGGHLPNVPPPTPEGASATVGTTVKSTSLAPRK